MHLPHFQQLVSHESAAPTGHANVTVMARKDHVEMVKFDSTDDEGFQAVMHYVNDMVKVAREGRSKIEAAAQAKRDEADRELRQGRRL